MSVRRMRQRMLQLLLCALPLAFTAPGCGSDEGPAEVPAWMNQGASGGTSTPQADGVGPEQNSVQAVAQNLERRRFGIEARDPFMHPIEVQPIDTVGTGEITNLDVPDCVVDQHPLGQTQPRALTLIALVTGTAVPRAMFNVGSDPQAVIVSEGARIGPNCTGEIREIRENEVVIMIRDSGDALPIEFTISLHNDLLDAGQVVEE